MEESKSVPGARKVRKQSSGGRSGRSSRKSSLSSIASSADNDVPDTSELTSENLELNKNNLLNGTHSDEDQITEQNNDKIIEESVIIKEDKKIEVLEVKKIEVKCDVSKKDDDTPKKTESIEKDRTDKVESSDKVKIKNEEEQLNETDEEREKEVILNKEVESGEEIKKGDEKEKKDKNNSQKIIKEYDNDSLKRTNINKAFVQLKRLEETDITIDKKNKKTDNSESEKENLLQLNVDKKKDVTEGRANTADVSDGNTAESEHKQVTNHSRKQSSEIKEKEFIKEDIEEEEDDEEIKRIDDIVIKESNSSDEEDSIVNRNKDGECSEDDSTAKLDFIGFESVNNEKSTMFFRILDDIRIDDSVMEDIADGEGDIESEKRDEDIMIVEDDNFEYEEDYDGSEDIFAPEVACVPMSSGSYQFNKDDILSTTSSTPSLSSVISGGGTSRKRTRDKSVKKQPVDLTLPQYLKPFEFGWKRELVFRSVSDSGTKRNADIYYYTPKGKKVRSTREVVENLTDPELTIDNFTFFKEPIGINDPEKEIIREAKIRGDRDQSSTPPPSKKVALPKTPKLVEAKTSKTPPTSASVSPSAVSETTKTEELSPSKASPSFSSTPKIVLKSVKLPPKSKSAKPFFTHPSKGGSKDKRSSRDSEDELEMGMLPPLWPTPPEKGTAREISPATKTGGGVKRLNDDSDKLPPAKRPKKESPQKKETSTTGATSITPKPANTALPPAAVTPQQSTSAVTPLSDKSSGLHKDYFMMNMSAIYKALLHSFQYLKVQELLRASRVCHLWRDIAHHKSLWQTVRMKNSRVRDWEGFANMLRSSGTKHLDLRKMLVPDKQEIQGDMWSEYARAIERVNMLLRIDMCRCPASAVENSVRKNSELQVLSALAIRSNSLNMAAFENCKHLTELRLKSSEKGGMELKNLTALKQLTRMKHLSLLTVKNMPAELSEVFESLVNLESVELGECSTLPESIAVNGLSKVNRLQRLRLEKGHGPSCPTIPLLNTISKLPTLTQLELINFDIKPGFDTALSNCTNLRTLLIIPTYVTQSATTNHVVMEGVSKLSKTLMHFVWGITLELLRVTDLFIDQWEGQKVPIKSPSSSSSSSSAGNTPKKGSGDSIPILKPLNEDSSKEGGGTPSQVDILQLPKLHKVLTALLPTTKIKILKVPFSATWRQTVTGPSNLQ
ncbi:uncharacterized protein LOC142331438 isoform X4 [Lycorma delicatula]|uniref:uncharacterized protein LOC142331438 isoform X4 n=1 Tax=Lycorma delicatula TaxID=130591 RepID=UPI003F5108FA